MSAAPEWLWLAYDAAMLPPVDEIARKKRVTVIINPNDGPAKDAAFIAAVRRWRKNKNITIKGYIDMAKWSGDGKLLGIKSSLDIKTEMGRYREWYGVTDADGFWMDDAFANNPSVKKAISGIAWTRQSSTILNPGEGLGADHWMMSLGFIVCNHEDPTPIKSRGGGAWIVFARRGEFSSAVSAATNAGVKLLGFEDIVRHHNREFQYPHSMWRLMC